MINNYLLKIALLKSGQNINESLACIDTRLLKVGQVFFALPGKNNDGHDFVHVAAAKGAAAVVVNKPTNDLVISQIIVDDVEEALVDFAKFWRTSVSPYCIAVTGSNGKTTTRAMIEHILKGNHRSSCATYGNYNNSLGVALSLLRLRSFHGYSVFEIGANGPNEIAKHTVSVKPSVGIFTNASACHLQGFKDIDGVVKTKSEIFSNMESGFAVINVDSVGARYCLTESEHLNVVTYGKYSSVVDYGFKDAVYDKRGFCSFTLVHKFTDYKVKLAVSGEHNIYNACATIAALHNSNLELDDIINAIGDFSGVDGRLKLHVNKSGVYIIDDTYNASPASYSSALSVAKNHFAKKKWLVCGDMAELGAKSKDFHMEVAQQVQLSLFSEVIAFGPKMQSAFKKLGISTHNISDIDELINFLSDKLQAGDVILLKGSRIMNLDKATKYLLQEHCL